MRELQEDRGHAVWVATLSSGEEVAMDDGRPGHAPASAWLRLRERVRAEGLRVVGLRLQFRSHVVRPVPADAPGYFFSKCSVGVLSGSSFHLAFYLVGHLTDSGVVVQRYKVPELVCVGSELRQVGPDDERLLCG